MALSGIMIITITKIIYLYIGKRCAFYKSLEQKTKQNKQKQKKTKTKAKKKKPHFGNIEYNSIEICTIVRCFAFKYFLLTQRQNLASCSVIAAGSISKYNYQPKYVSGRLISMLDFAL